MGKALDLGQRFNKQRNECNGFRAWGSESVLNCMGLFPEASSCESS